MPTTIKPDQDRANIKLNPDSTAELRAIASAHGITLNAALRRCISVYTYVAAANVAGQRVSVIDATAGTERELVLL